MAYLVSTCEKKYINNHFCFLTCLKKVFAFIMQKKFLVFKTIETALKDSIIFLNNAVISQRLPAYPLANLDF